MNKLATLIEQMPLTDLLLLKKDLEAGNLHKLIARRIETLQVTKTCPTCGEELLSNEIKYAIEFGPNDLRQKAYFDEYDCLTYFLDNRMKPQQHEK